MAISFTGNKITNQEYGTSTIDKFNGVDKTTTPTEVDNSRAIDMSNYLPDGNSLVKRYGVKKIELDILEKAVIDLHIDDIELLDWWKYKDYDICFIKCNHTVESTMYHFGFLYQKSTETNPTFYGLTGSTNDETHSQAIEYEGKLFILCNCGYFMFDNTFVNLIDYETNSISFETYIPTRYIIPTYNSENEKDTNVSTLEKLNIASNKFAVKTLPLNETKLSYTLHQLVNVDVSNPNNNLGVIYLELDGYVDLSDYVKYKPAVPLSYILLDLSEYSDILQQNQTIKQIPMSYDDNKKMYNIKSTFTPSQIGGSSDVEIWFKPLANIQENVNIVKKALEKMELKFYFIDDSLSIKLNDFKYFKPFGTDGYTDRLFIFGNSNYPNLDIHSGYASQSNERWKDYTYFPDDSYQTLGSSDSAITGYGILSNGVMAIFKQSKNNEPNLFFRNAVNTTKMSSDGTIQSTLYGVDEYYPITRSGVNIGSDYFEQVIQFGNDLLINTPSGLYRIDVGTSTATQTYYAKEVSYFLRNELSSDMTGSIHCVYGNMLFIKRKNKEGKYRIYVADMNRYSFKDSIQQYEWWILDDINVDMFKVVNNKLYLINSNGVYNFNDGSFYDEDYIYTNQIRVGDEWFDSELFFDRDDDEFILSSDSFYIKNAINSSNKHSAYNELKSNMHIQYSGEGLLVFKNIEYTRNEHLSDITIQVEGEQITFSRESLNLKGNDLDLLYSIWCNMASEKNDLTYIVADFIDTGNSIILNVEYINTNEVNIIFAYSNTDGVNTITWEDLLSVYNTSSTPSLYVDLNELSNKDMLNIIVDEMFCFKDSEKYDLSHVFNNDEKLIYANTNTGQYVELDNAIFNTFTYAIMLNNIKYNNVRLEFSGVSNLINYSRTVKIVVKKPVKAYWYSHFNQCNRIDYLKTADYMYFVPETKRGGLTHIGYRTNKKEVGYDARYFTKQLDFNDIDFNEFSFGELEFGHSISSKKKIKNFAFIQLIAYSNNEKDSTLAQLTFRYKYTKNNKGVK